MKLSKLIGKTVSGVTDSWDGDFEGDGISLDFDDGTVLTIFACDCAEPGACSSVCIVTEIEEKL